MKLKLPLVVLSSLCLISSPVWAQKDRFAYAITDLTREGGGWNALRRIDLGSGTCSEVLLNGTEQKTVYDAASKKPFTPASDARLGNQVQLPFGTGVAAAAYDKKHNRLYFTPMFVDQLRYIDLKTMEVFYITGQALTGMVNTNNDEGKIVTRMVITPDGDGYAITNDASSMVRFTTGKKPRIEQLGALVDDPSNNTISIHNRCSSFGGDMIADDQGNLYILSAQKNVFVVNTKTKVARLLASITQLPDGFTVNGAVVDAEGSLLVSSAVDGSSYYVVNPATWSATAYTASAGIYRSSDLANSNFLSSGVTAREIPLIKQAAGTNSKAVSVYPNPVSSNTVRIQFHAIPNGDYTIELTDAVGRRVLQKQITVNQEEQIQNLSLGNRRAQGSYVVRVINRGKQSVYIQKLLVQ
ncbi:MAG TPA: T9SS type A sorting domain-containing protein [Flavisolibacter sp.]|jgi:hypothetical protein|nr:T9SS type A sorting domain-containing protein [Flavisolibacter sp.]